MYNGIVYGTNITKTKIMLSIYLIIAQRSDLLFLGASAITGVLVIVHIPE